MTNIITFNNATYVELQKAYRIARKKNKEVFTFRGSELLTEYAKYMLEYLEMQGLGKEDDDHVK